MASVDWGSRFTNRTSAVLAGAVVALLLAGAVALATHDDAPGSSTTRTAPEAGSPATGSESAPVPAAADASPSRRAAASSTEPPGTADDTAAGHVTTTTASSTTTSVRFERYHYPVTLEPTCVPVGGNVTLKLRVEPGMAVSIFAAYPDGDAHGTQYEATAPDNGIVIRTLPAPPALGVVRVVTSATREGDGTVRFGRTNADFRIAAVC